MQLVDYAGIFPPEGEEFDPRAILDNAARDRDFVLGI